MLLKPRTVLISASLALAFVFVLISLSNKAKGHDIYSDWKQPGSGGSCCNGGESGDCYPTEARFEHGQWIAQRREDGRWLVVPHELVLKDGSTPDGAAHLCAPKPLYDDDTRIYCFRPPWSGG